MKIALASDHGGYKLKHKIGKFLEQRGYQVLDLGTTNVNNVDFPDYGFKLGKAVAEKMVDFGIGICTTGMGMGIACNKVKGVRCAVVQTKKDAEHAREHFDANAMALRGTMSFLTAVDIVDTFIKTKPLQVERYNRRIEKLNSYEGK